MGSVCCCLHVEFPEETADGSTHGGCKCPGCLLNKFLSKFPLVTRDERISNGAAILEHNIAAPSNSQNETIMSHSITFPFGPNQSVADQLHKVTERQITSTEVEEEQKSDNDNPESLNSPSQEQLDTRDEDECPTCLEEYEYENPKILTECNHHFHLGCIYEWMERSQTCPICSKVMLFSDRS